MISLTLLFEIVYDKFPDLFIFNSHEYNIILLTIFILIKLSANQIPTINLKKIYNLEIFKEYTYYFVCKYNIIII